jgi:putative hydrolase of the HAD superfamily
VTAVTRACLIDVYDTILTIPFVPRMTALADSVGLPAEAWLAEWEKMREDRDRGRLTIQASFGRVLAALGTEPEPGVLAGLSRRDAELTRSMVRLCDDVKPFLTELRARGVLTALVSNCGDTTRPLLSDLGIIPLVDAIVLSCEVGSVKPYPEIYATALDELGVAAVDAVFIDDQPTFCVGAEAVGVRPLQIARHEGITPASQWNFPLVHSLFEVVPLL